METACPRNEDRGERRALHVLHHQVRHAVGRAIVVVMDLDHARMGQQARVPALLAEPVPELWLSAYWGRSSFTATIRSSRVSRARHTSPMPPAATLLSSR